MMVSLHIGSFITGTVFGFILCVTLISVVVIKEC